MATIADPKNARRIIVEKNGPYIVKGGVPLVRKRQVVSEYGEPLTWEKTGEVEAGKTYLLCRCGHSKNRPFCDDSHLQVNFDGTETAATDTTPERQEIYPGGSRIVVKRDHAICMESGFCGTRLTNIRKMLKDSADPQVRAQIMAMIERCPSGSYSYSIEPETPNVEPDLPQQIALITEITDDGPIEGPLWVTGNIVVERSDGQPFETRNRVTLCNCGESKIKPLCDGTHRELKNRVIG
ncbi:MAG: CDGSH iron-sulfur domain-containing protein [Chloroflexi bacterium]|nr:CDGSH iron-sulfur domain-containing protein [Chloroflexota bacterium]